MTRVRPRIVALALAVACAGVAVVSESCSTGPTTEAEREHRSQALIESGNVAYKQGDYRLAARRYAAAAVVRKDDPAAYYGMGMALSKLGRDEEARAAYLRAKELAQAAEARTAVEVRRHAAEARARADSVRAAEARTRGDSSSADSSRAH